MNEALEAICRMTRSLSANENWCKTFDKYSLHPLVAELLKNDRAPSDIARLAFEWPHESETGDLSKIAYARDDRSHEQQKHVRTSLAKYIRRHWSCLKDHEIRDLVAPYLSDKFEILTDPRDMVCAALFGPESCMKWGEFEMGRHAYEAAKKWHETREGESGWEFDHPYCVYSPNMGWAVAVRLDPQGGIVGRAVVHLKRKLFVRTYVLRSDPTAQSSDDDKLKVWLLGQGFKKVDYWPEGVEFAYFPNSEGEPFMPYLDSACGSTYQSVRVNGGRVVRDDGGDYVANRTDGLVNEVDPVAWCYHCEGVIRSEDDLYTARIGGSEVVVCPHCADTHFVEARFSYWFRADETLVHEGDVVRVYARDDWMQLWDGTALSNDIVQLDEPAVADGALCHYAYEHCVVATHDGRIIVKANAVEVDGKFYYYKDPEARASQTKTV